MKRVASRSGLSLTLSVLVLLFLGSWMAYGCKSNQGGVAGTSSVGGAGAANAGGMESGAITHIGHRDLSVFPPQVRDASVHWLEEKNAEGNAILMVRFVEQGLPRQLMLHPEGRDIALRDDGQGGDEKAGDGTYTARANLDLVELAANERKLAERVAAREPAKPAKIARFEGRALKEIKPFPLIDIAKLRPGVKFDIPMPPPPAIDPSTINPEQSLMIRDPKVVLDPLRTMNPCTGAGTPGGKWTFRYLMEQMANTSVTGIDAPTFVERWLRRWEFDQVVNDWLVPNRSAGVRLKILDDCQVASGGAGHPLDLDKAPFRLLAIVNRVDLRGNVVYGGGSAGEARFVFGLVKKDAGGGCHPELMTVIFEYGIHVTSCAQLKAWAQSWFDLSSIPLADPADPAKMNPAYGAALEAITETFVTANANPSKPNGSALNQLRTNEIAFQLGAPPAPGGPVWELREFQIAGGDSDVGHLRQATVKQTPDISLNSSQAMVDFVNANAGLIVGPPPQQHNVQLDFPAGTHFLGGAAALPNPAFFWTDGGGASIAVPEARRQFSLATCNACHGGETGTQFTHVKPESPFNAPVNLSGFLTGINVNDPAGKLPPAQYGDLQRRQEDLATLVGQPCLFQLFFRPLRMTH